MGASTMSEGHTLLRRVSAFLSEADMPPSLFGREVMRDPQFVFDLRRGRTPGQRVSSRVDGYMRAWREARREAIG